MSEENTKEEGANASDVVSNDTQVTRSEDGRFLPGQSGNPNGRPQGSKNRLTLMKLVAEEASREQNFDKMLQVVADVVESALMGDQQCRKLVWDSIMSKGLASDTTQAKEKVTINIKGPSQEVIDVTPDPAEETDESPTTAE